MHNARRGDSTGTWRRLDFRLVYRFDITMPIDEGPSQEDLQRFGSDEAYCSECGETVWDQAEFCPACGTQLSGRTLTRPPEKHFKRQGWMLVVIIIVLIAFFLAVAL